MRPFLTLHQPNAAEAFYHSGLWQKDTLYSLARQHAEQSSERVALVDRQRRLTWREVVNWADGIAADLRSYGLVAGDRVCVWAGNNAEVIALLLACSREGFACNPSLHRSHTCAEVAGLVERLDARALVAQEHWGADRTATNLDAILARIKSLRILYDLETFPTAQINRTPWDRNPDKVVYLAFTSGTTGEPKCVMHSDNTLLANARELVRDWRVSPATTIMSLSPLSHHIAWVAVAQWLVSGCRFVVNDPPPGQSSLDWIHDQKVTYVLGVPTHAIDILGECQRRGLDLASVKTFYMAGAPIPPSVCHMFAELGVTPQNVYGMTENSSHQYTHPDDEPAVATESCGRGGAAYEVSLFDPTDPDIEVPVGQIGQIGGRGAALMLGYFADQAANEQSFNRTGWFMSGDLGVLDEAGNLSIVGRLKDVIIRGGHNIYPAHIEALALRHRGIRQVACFPVPDKRLGERVCIAISGELTPDALLAHLADEGLSPFDMPEYFVKLDLMPTTASGKILKRRLVEMAGHDFVPEPISALNPRRRTTDHQPPPASRAGRQQRKTSP